MPRTKGSRNTKTATHAVERETQLEKTPSRSYTNLIYGALSVIVLFLLVYAGVRAIQNRGADITDEAVKTQDLALNNQKGDYVVKEGDTLWSISEAKYGSGYSWTKIAQANNIKNPEEIEKGMSLKIPEVKGTSPVTMPTAQVTQNPTPTVTLSKIPAKETPVAPQPGSKGAPASPQTGQTPTGIKGNTYTVVKGDHLWGIAVRAYGDGYKWVEIARANNLLNPNLIHPGNVLKLPR